MVQYSFGCLNCHTEDFIIIILGPGDLSVFSSELIIGRSTQFIWISTRMAKNKSKDPIKDDSPSEIDSSVILSCKANKNVGIPPEPIIPATPLGVRVGGRMKKAKVVFDPSDNYVPRKKGPASVNTEIKPKFPQIKRNSSDSSLAPNASKHTKPARTSNAPQAYNHKAKQRDQLPLSSDAESTDANYYSGLCLICLKPGQNTELLNCSVMYCNYKAHLTCLNLSNDEFDLTLLQNQWQCPHCKTCVECFENAEAGNLTLCSICGDAYHSICHKPRISSTVDSENWKCLHCTNLSLKSLMKRYPSNTTTPSSTNTTVQISPTIKKELDEGNCSENAEELPAAIILLDKIKKENLEEHKLELPLTPPPSQPSHSLASSTNDINMGQLIIKDEFAGFSDVESSPKNTTTYIKPNYLKRKSTNHYVTTVKLEEDAGICKKKRNLRSTSFSKSNGAKPKESNNSTYKLDEQKKKQLQIFQEEYKLFSGKPSSRTPDASNWTGEDVYLYFRKYFPLEASVFKDQEIDGSSLLLMKRSDVIDGLNIKLGPALKIYRHVIMLQTRNNDPRLSWL